MEPQTATPVMMSTFDSFAAKEFGMNNRELRSHLQSVNIQDVLSELAPRHRIVCCAQDESLGVALKKMKEEHVTSCLVENADKVVIGSVDLNDICRFICSHLELPPHSVSELNREKFEKLVEEGNAFTAALSGHLVDNYQDSLHTIGYDTSVFDVISMFSTEIHRAVCIDANGVHRFVLSQSDIVEYLAKLAHNLVDFQRMTCANCVPQPPCETYQVVKVKDTDSVLTALELMFEYAVTGLAIVNEDNQLVGNFSSSDLVQLDEKNFWTICLSVHSFLELYGRKHDPVFCTTEMSVEMAMLKMVVHKFHRCYVVDNRKCPIGVISATDVMQTFARILKSND